MKDTIMNDWSYNGKPFTEASEDYYGFVYEITEKSTGKKYIGKKSFWSTRMKPATKSYKRRRRVVKESDWQGYYGSSENLKEEIQNNTVENYDRKILRLCKSKGEMSYYEAKEQFDNDVLFRDDYYNEFIGCKIHSKHLKK